MRALQKVLMVLGLMGIAVAGISGGNEGVKKEIIAQERATREIASSTTSINKVVIGVLDVETAYTLTGDTGVSKNAVMRELKRNPRVKVVDIRESCRLSDLKRHGYERAERYRDIYQLDMILHVNTPGFSPDANTSEVYFRLIDLYARRVKEISIEIRSSIPIELELKGTSRKILVKEDLKRVLRAKKEVFGKKEMTAPPEVKEPPKRAAREVAPPATSISKVVIGVLNFETSGGVVYALEGSPEQWKKALIRELKRNARVTLVEIRESCSLSGLKRHGYERAERYKNTYQLDMILHTDMVGPSPSDIRSLFYFSLMDLYTKRVKEVSIETVGTRIELGFRGISQKLLVSQDLNRVLKAKKEALAKKEVAVSAEAKEIPKRETKEIAPPATPINKVVIGVLDFERSGVWGIAGPKGGKKALMRDLKRDTRVKLVDIDESCSLSDLKRHGYKKAEKYKMDYQLDMILHTGQIDRRYYFRLIDLYRKRVKEVSIETVGTRIELGFRGISNKLLVSEDLKRVLRAKKEVSAKKEVAVLPEVKEPPERAVKKSPQEIEDLLIQKGPTLIAEGQYDRVLELIEDLPGKRRRLVQIQILGCFANLKGWVSNRDQSCKLSWWNLRQSLINSGDNEATPILMVFLKVEDPWLRTYAAELLGHIGDKRALKDLRAAGENDESYKVRKYAKWAYEQIFGEKL